MVHAVVASFFGLGSEDLPVPTFWSLLHTITGPCLPRLPQGSFQLHYSIETVKQLKAKRIPNNSQDKPEAEIQAYPKRTCVRA